MLVVCLKACDVVFPGAGHPADRTKALFPGDAYDLPTELAEPFIATGFLIDRDGPVQVPTDDEAEPVTPREALVPGHARRVKR